MEVNIIRCYSPYGGMDAKIVRGFTETHPGLDTASDRWNQPVYALFDGRIVASRFDPQWGMVCEYQSHDGSVTVSYRHMASVAFVVGREIKAGERLGIEGCTGSLAMGRRFLYTGLWVGSEPVNPLPFLSGEREIPFTSWKGGIKMNHKVGEIVRVKGSIYQNAWGSGAALPGYGKQYAITEIHTGAGRKKPYQLGTVGFVGNDDISGLQVEASVPKAEYERVQKENEALRSMLEEARQALFPDFVP